MDLAAQTTGKLTDFLHSFPTKNYRRGEIILFGDDQPINIHFIVEGYVKVYSIDNGGNEKLITFDRENEFFPIGWAFFKDDASPYYYEAYTDCQICLIPREQHQRFLQENPEAIEPMFDYFITRYMDLSGRVNSLVQAKAALKLGYTLQFLMRRFGEHQASTWVIKHPPLPQQALAGFTGLTRETVNLELQKMKRAGVLRYDRSHLVIDEQKLQLYLGEEGC